MLSGIEEAECFPGSTDPLPGTDLARIVYAYRQWRGESAPDGWDKKQHGAWKYADIAGFCRAATIDEISKHGHVLTPGRYVGAEDVEDDGEPFAEKYPRLVAEVEECFKEGERLGSTVRQLLRGVDDVE